MQRVGHSLVAGHERIGVRGSDPALIEWPSHSLTYAVGVALGVVAGVLTGSVLFAGILIVYLSA